MIPPEALRRVMGGARHSCWLALCLLLLASCRPETAPLPTRVAEAESGTDGDGSGGVPVPATWTPRPGETRPAFAAGPTFTPRPTRTPLILPPTATSSATPLAPTATPLPTDTPAPTATPTWTGTGSTGVNLLPNPSFEEGWYHIDGIPELQIPARWQFTWQSGPNELAGGEWVRPEVRVLPADALPAHEHDTFIWDGTYTVKVFKGSGAISFRLETSVYLQAGSYRLVTPIFPDLVSGYTADGEKIWAPDPLSGEISYVINGVGQSWMLPRFGQKNLLAYAFDVEEAGLVSVGVAMRGRWPIANNGWFMDDWGLYRAEN